MRAGALVLSGHLPLAKYFSITKAEHYHSPIYSSACRSTAGEEFSVPEIKCDYGHATHISTPQWIDLLTLDQMKRAVELMGEKITAAEAQPKRVIWRVCCGGLCLANCQEDQYEKAADHLLRIYKESFMEEADDYVKKPYGTEVFRRSLPSMETERVTQFEYETEWFPPLNPA